MRDFPFNGEPVILYHDESALDDTGTVVMFRRSDVIAAGDLFSTVSYPRDRCREWRQRAGHDRWLNRILDLTVPSKSLAQGGTYVIPGHGRIADENDVVRYRDMLQIISDRVRDMVAKKMTLAQVIAAKPSLDYDGRYGSDTGPWTTAMFIEALYRDPSKGGASTR